MRVIKHNFRLYPYDPSFYQYDKEEEVLENTDIGIFATNHKRSLVFIMNLSERDLNYKAIKKIPAYIEKYAVDNQHHEPYPENNGVWYTNPSHLNQTMLYGNQKQL